MSSHGGSSHETDRPLRARDQLPNALPGRTAQSEPQHHQGLPRCVHAPAPLLSRPARRRPGTIVSRPHRCTPGGSVPGSPSRRPACLDPHAKPSPRGFARVLPLCAVGSARALAAEPADPRHSIAATSAPKRWIPLQGTPCANPRPTRSAYPGRRDAVLLSVLYDTGARVQELIDLNAGDVRLDSPAQVRLMGKGQKMRAVPLMDATVDIVRDRGRENGLDRPEHADQPLFQNRQGGRLTRTGVRYLLQKYVEVVRRDHPGFTQPVSPHSLRHTKGMHLLQSGVPLEIIRDFLGHVDVKTTEIYARANLEMKRKALEKAADGTPLPKIPSWTQNKTLLEWLHSL